MATRKTPTARKSTRSRISTAELERRLKELERRVAILEAKQAQGQPTLADRLAETVSSSRRVERAQNQ